VRQEGVGRTALRSWLGAARYEVLPTDDVEGLVAEHVPHDVTITITASPRRGMQPTIRLAETLSRQGYRTVPHLSARLIRDRSELSEILAAVKEMGGTDVFVIAGDAREPAGEFPDSVSLLEAMAQAGAGVRDIGISGYPESHSFIDDDMTIQAMWDKRKMATYIVSNLCFDPKLLKKWVARVRRRKVELPIQIGMAGVTDPAKLMRVSTRIGIADSAHFLRGHSNWLLRMLRPGGYDPERFVGALLPVLAAADRKVTGLHVFTFNEIEPTERWRQDMLARLT
jgi:methylenetetrahydrofolate reductase (NADPH)